VNAMDTIYAGFFEVDDWQAQYLREGTYRLGIADRVQVDFISHPLIRYAFLQGNPQNVVT